MRRSAESRKSTTAYNLKQFSHNCLADDCNQAVAGRGSETNQSCYKFLLIFLITVFSGFWSISCERETDPEIRETRPDVKQEARPEIQQEIVSDRTQPVTNPRFANVDRIIETGIKDSLYSAAVLLIGNREGVLHHRAYGHPALFDISGDRIEAPEQMTIAHLFDLASLTKIFATTYSLMHLHSQGLLEVDEPVSRYIPEFDTPDKNMITARHLLTHSSGLMPWFPTYYTAESSSERRIWTAGERLDGHPGEERRYSDLGFMVLADLIEAVSGKKMDVYLNESIYQPLGVNSTLFSPAGSGEENRNIVSTSHGNPFEKRMVYDDEFGYQVDTDPESWDQWRTYVLRGEVSDGNAHHTHNGVAGHAGLFSTASDLYQLLLPVMQGGAGYNEIFRQKTLEQFLDKDTFGNGLGWAMDPQIYSAGDLTELSYGHTGFTGTHFVVLPERNLAFILLSNRQHFGVDESGRYPNLNDLRRAVFDEITHSYQRVTHVE